MRLLVFMLSSLFLQIFFIPSAFSEYKTIFGLQFFRILKELFEREGTD